jgi:chaperonin cofactor prefoldin
VLAELETAEARSKQLKQQWGDPSFYQRTTPVELSKLELEERELSKRIERLTSQWEALETELESLADA